MSSVNNILELKRKSFGLGLCGKYKSAWDDVTDAKGLFDLAMSVDGVEYLADGIAFGWGLTKDYLLREFDGFINGKYVSRQNGYTSAMFVGGDGEVTVNTTVVLFVGHKGKIRVPRSTVSKIYLCDDCEVDLLCEGRCEAYLYGKKKSNTLKYSLSDRGKLDWCEIDASVWV